MVSNCGSVAKDMVMVRSVQAEAAMTDKPMSNKRLCVCCHYPIHPAETGLRYYGHGDAHSEDRCLWFLKEEIRRLLETEARLIKANAEVAHINVGYLQTIVNLETVMRDAIDNLHRIWNRYLDDVNQGRYEGIERLVAEGKKLLEARLKREAIELEGIPDAD